jgi:uncharacterized protein YcbX
MTARILTGLYRYPVKSMRGGSLERMPVTERGPVGDRQWMVVDQAGRFLTQRQQARMCLIEPTLGDAGELELVAPGMSPIRPRVLPDQCCDVLVWSDTVEAETTDSETDRWLSTFLGVACRLVRFADDRTRPVDRDYAQPQDQVGFADGFPFLLISEASLQDLNARLDRPVPMERFRPNLVISGCEPFEEDRWQRIRIGAMTFRVAKPCSRCIIPTIDIASAQRSAEPLRTLMSYRKRDNKVYFGQNLIHDGSGMLEHGMPVEVIA